MSLIDTHFGSSGRQTLGSHLFTADEIVRFARKYDPQRFHVDAGEARASIFGGLCASGWHTTAVWMRKNVERLDALAAAMAERRDRPARLRPVARHPQPALAQAGLRRRGDRLLFDPVAERSLASRPGWHLLENVAEAETADGKPVMRFESAVLVRPRS